MSQSGSDARSPLNVGVPASAPTRPCFTFFCIFWTGSVIYRLTLYFPLTYLSLIAVVFSQHTASEIRPAESKWWNVPLGEWVEKEIVCEYKTH